MQNSLADGFVASEEPSALERVAAASDFGNGISSLHQPDPTVTLHRERAVAHALVAPLMGTGMCPPGDQISGMIEGVETRIEFTIHAPGRPGAAVVAEADDAILEADDTFRS